MEHILRAAAAVTNEQDFVVTALAESALPGCRRTGQSSLESVLLFDERMGNQFLEHLHIAAA